ncbi:MAG: hypothetical protein JWN08_2684 [Frankiales bacterium]|nr:hypothetical protein [Frankiales bacterium]
MASDGKDDAVEGSWSPKRPRTAGEQRSTSTEVPSAVAPSTAGKDPEALAADIERTREELAETLDAIADKVSPKRVAKRTKAQVGERVKETAAKAEDAVKTGAHAAAETVKEAAGSVKESAIAATAAAKEKVGGTEDASSRRLSAPSPVLAAPHPLSQETVTIPVSSAGALADATPPPVTAPAGSQVPPYRSTTSAMSTAPSRLPVYAGAAAALAVVLLLLRRRRR